MSLRTYFISNLHDLWFIILLGFCGLLHCCDFMICRIIRISVDCLIVVIFVWVIRILLLFDC